MAALSRMNYLDKQTFPVNDINQPEEPEQSEKLEQPKKLEESEVLIDTKNTEQPDTILIESIEEDSSIIDMKEVSQAEIETDVVVESTIEATSETDKLMEMTEEIYDENYMFPSVDLLLRPVKLEPNAIDDWVLEQAEILNETLDAFNINAQVIGWTIGPAVTQFELQLGRGVKVNKITNLSDDLKLSLAAKDIRIEV